MYKQVLNSISDIDLFPVISLILFVSFFVLMLIRVIYTRKDYVEHMSNLPLDEDSMSSESVKQ